MAVAFDASSESHTGTTASTSVASFSWTHTPVGTPKGVWVSVHTFEDADDVGSVTYGGNAMTLVDEAIKPLDEPCRCKLFWLGNPPSGAQTVQVNRTNNADRIYAIACTVTAATATVEICGLIKEEGNVTIAQKSVDDGSVSGTNSVRFFTGTLGNSTPPSIGANSTFLQTIDVGAMCAQAARETTAGQGSRPVGVSSAFSDDSASFYFAIREVVGTTHTAAIAITGTAAVSLPGKVTYSGVAAVSGSLAVSPIGTLALSGVSALAAALSVAPLGALTLKGASAHSLAAVLAALGGRSFSAAAAMATTGVLTPAATVDSGQKAALAGSLAVSAVPLLTLKGAGAYATTLTVSPRGILSFSIKSALSTSGLLAALQNLTLGGRAALQDAATLAAVANLTANAKAAVSGTGAITAPGKLDLGARWAQDGTAVLSPTPVINQLGIALLAATGAVSAVSVTEQPGSAALAAIAALSPTAILTFLRSRRMAAGYGFPVPTQGGGVVVIQQRLDGGFVQRKP